MSVGVYILKLSRYFNEVLSCLKILPGLKDNLKSQELFEILNDYWLLKERQVKDGNYYKPEDIIWYFDSDYEIDMFIKGLSKKNLLHI